MNQKEYELIAGVLKTSKQWNKNFADDTYLILCENFANKLQRTYASFDREKFLAACEASL